MKLWGIARTGLALMTAATLLTHPAIESQSIAQSEPTLVVEDMVSIVSNSYRQGADFGHAAAVIFRVKNTSPTQAAVNVPYRVTIEAPGSPTFISEGRDSVTVWPLETRMGVFHTNDPSIVTRPERARVQVYPSTSMMRPTGPSSQSGWRLDNQVVRCPGGLIECEVLGDLIWSGIGAKRPVYLAVAVYQGGEDGPLVAAGAANLNVAAMDPGQAAPVRAPLRGFDQPTPGVAPVLPEGPFTVNIYVETDS